MNSPKVHHGAPKSTPARSGGLDAARGPLVVVTFVIAVGVVGWLATLSVPAAAAGFGLLALALAVYPVLGHPDERTATILPALVAVAVLGLVAVALRPIGDTSLSRFSLVVVPSLVTVVAAARACPRGWLRLRPGTGGWLTQTAIVVVGIPLGLPVLLLAPHPVGARGGVPLAVVIAIIALFALSLEILFRGLLVPALTPFVGRKDVAAAAAIYALTFISYGLGAVIAGLIVAVVLGLFRRGTDSVVGVIGAHIAFGLFVYFAAASIGM